MRRLGINLDALAVDFVDDADDGDDAMLSLSLIRSLVEECKLVRGELEWKWKRGNSSLKIVSLLLRFGPGSVRRRVAVLDEEENP